MGAAALEYGMPRESVPDIQLVPRRQPNLQGDYPDYHVYAGEQLVGRIYQSHNKGWNWAINSVSFDDTVGWTMHGHTPDMAQAKYCLRLAFDKYLPWALAIGKDDPKFRRVDQDLRRMGAR